MSQYPLANRDEQLELFDQMVAGDIRERILLLQAPGGMGKTTLVTEFLRRCPPEVPCLPIDLKGGPGLHQVLARICDRLGWQHFGAFTARVEQLAQETTVPSAAGSQFEHVDLERYDVAAIHDLMLDAFTVPDLRRFCRYRPPFDEILPRFGQDPDLEDAIEVVIGFCQQRVWLSDLLLAIREERFGHYRRYYARIYRVEVAAPQPAGVGTGALIGRAEIEGALRAPDEGGRATRRGALTRALFEDLAVWPGRLVFLFDTYEQADPEVQAWLAESCLACVERAANLVVVVAGRQVPEERLEWAACCRQHSLARVEDVDTWDEYVRRNGWDVPRAWIEGYCAATRGNPAQMDVLLVGAAQSGGER